MSTSTTTKEATTPISAARLHYSMIIEWDPRDDIYVVTVPELPGCRTHGRTYEEAISQGQEAIESWVESAIADNATPPAPRHYQHRSAFAQP
jgi:predicted RNase H-like HicB family nuclease